MKEASLYLELIDKEKNIYNLASLYSQNRVDVEDYIDILIDPYDKSNLKVVDNLVHGANRKYELTENIVNFTNHKINSEDWVNLNNQFLNYHKSLSAYTLLNSSPINNYLSLDSGIGFERNLRVLDVGGGTGHTHASFFQFPDEIEYFLLDPNLRLLHDQFIRIFPKLTYLKMAHILAYAENIPFQDNSFDLILNISSVDHMNDYKKFISEVYRVLKPGGKFLISSHLDVSCSNNDKVKFKDKMFSYNFFERLSRYLYFKKHHVGSDDHTLHLEDEKPIEIELLKNDFKILKQKIFKRYFYFVAQKK